MSEPVDFEAVFLAGPSATAVLSREFVILAVNHAYEAVSGHSREDLIGRNVFQAFPDDPRDPGGARALRASLDRVLATRQRHAMALQRYDVAVPDRPGVVEQRYWSPVNAPVLDADGSVRFVVHRVEEVTDFLHELSATAPEAATGEVQAMQAEVFARSRELQQANQQLSAAADITTALLADIPPAEVLELIASRAREIAQVDQALLLAPDDDGEQLIVAAAAGAKSQAYRAVRLPLDESTAARSLAVRVYRTGRSAVDENAAQAGREAGLSPDVAVGSALGVPLGSPGAVRGVLSVVNEPGHPVVAGRVVRSLELFAAQAAIALELAERKSDAERLSLLDDRERIAQELNTSVVARLSGIGLDLSAALRIIQRPDAAHRVRDAVRTLDDVIRRLNSAVFASRPEHGREQRLHRRIYDLVDAAAASLGVATTTRVDSRLDTALDRPAAGALIEVLDTALSEVAHRPTARHVLVIAELHTAPTRVYVRVEDDGTPAAPAVHSTRSGGDFATAARAGGGTTVTWQLPIEKTDLAGFAG
ncbi:PAS domain-containing protein [Amycolatopsis benzoatilytica]|uniref:PAS domain-containing protein n=1 Tax=Amycolatopsis benzoatilytica TaxID=346045 RepID=UPI000365A7A0|nr:PAS domain-containing protein [Amycolatopsis benzoatilytica]